MTLESKTYLVVLFALLSAIFFNVSTPLYMDESYYWLWSKHLSLSYYDHPYMIAYFIKLCTLFGDDIWMIRTVNLISFSGAAFFIFKTADYLFDRRSALYAVILFILSPAVTLGLTITTPDSPLILFWSASLYFAAKAFFDKRINDYLLAGLMGGFALSSKYTAILLLASYFLFLAIKTPREWMTSRPYLALLASIIAFLPVIFWNIDNDFISFAFQYHHGNSGGENRLHLMDDLAFLGGMAGMFNPVFFLLLLSLFTRKESYSDPKQFFVILPALLTIVFFLYKGVYKKMELNWVAPAFISAGIAVAHLISRQNLTKTFYAGVILSLILIGVIRYPLVFGLEGKHNPQNRLFGYEELAHHLQGYPPQPIFADHLTLASSLTYSLRKEVWVPIPTRKSQFDWWQKGMNFKTQSGIFVSRYDRANELKAFWKYVELDEVYTARKKGFKEKSFYIYQVSN
ncbi:glycosyltransferase family 39 protein [uncultured Sulfuricurvum sp.]|uniref:ArnT family glycosyltransferase n=2 Tax=Sulfuricurvum TaxID=286130 RepID=UPI0026315BB9|nr:glycosyltransferase family 39 protein [uncultured Sulfuricurvum sp.]